MNFVVNRRIEPPTETFIRHFVVYYSNWSLQRGTGRGVRLLGIDRHV